MFESSYGIERMAMERGPLLREEVRQCKAIKNNKSTLFILISVCIVLIAGCTITPLISGSFDPREMRGGVYEGFYEGGLNSARVEVSVGSQEIKSINIIEHDALLGVMAEAVIIKKILEQQTLNVDAVSGATNSSNVIINAVKVALDKACREE
ncbi:MAG: FMN-binding protein [Spirochaetales bacterium]|uniref:FMN-binding protein n=1 Tax=Candidatus Thalassospirochaeta sargassi TaxID=3119039 RepID=A0AAJ1ID90_9SPIO|nr:FMN-binding protein [Spirochaetales bacterium]